MKLHVGADCKTGLVHSALVTSANVHDKHPLPELLHRAERRVYGDRGYQGCSEIIKTTTIRLPTRLERWDGCTTERLNMRRADTPVMRIAMSLLVIAFTAASRVALAASDIPFLKAERWVNSAPLAPEALRGKVVLVDFWEYTCINWIRTLPYVKAWDREYAQLGLVVIGVHAPEFEFGKRAENIDRGIRDHELKHPIALDNDFAIWRAFGNDAWPAKYLFDAQGKLVRRWVGEGSYDQIESEIRRLLTAATPGIALPEISREASAFAKVGEPSYRGITAETYLGTDRRERDTFTLEGAWQSRGQFVELRAGTGKIVLPFTAGEVNLVVKPGPSGASSMTVLLDGRPIGDAHGADVGSDGVARFDRAGMIRLVTGAAKRKHVLTLVTSDPGVQAYVFTFGPSVATSPGSKTTGVRPGS